MNKLLINISVLIFLMLAPTSASSSCRNEFDNAMSSYRAWLSSAGALGREDSVKHLRSVQEDYDKFLDGKSYHYSIKDNDHQVTVQTGQLQSKISLSGPNPRPIDKSWIDMTLLDICKHKFVKNKSKSGVATSSSNATAYGAGSSPQNQAKDNQRKHEIILAQERAAEHQRDIDLKRRGKRKEHCPSCEAHQCISPVKSGLFGYFQNSCGVKVSFEACNAGFKKDSWASSFDCDKNSFGLYGVKPTSQAAAHINGASRIHWFACKNGATPADVEYRNGQIYGRCYLPAQ